MWRAEAQAKPRIEAWRNVIDPAGTALDRAAREVFENVVTGDIGGDRYDGQDQQVVRARENLIALLAEVRAQPPADDLTVLQMSQANLFCIPMRPGAALGYDFRLATRYRLAVSAFLSDTLAARLQGVGPFLVALKVPVDELAAADPSHLYVTLIDLGDAEPAAIAIFVRAFKSAIRSKGVAQEQELSSLRGAAA